MFKSKKIWLACLLPLALAACNNNDEDISENDSNETGQQIGETMAAMDEAGGSSGELALLQSNDMTFDRYAPKDIQVPFWKKLGISEAHAVSCLAASTFGTCSSNTITHTFDDCTILLAKFDGTVTFTWGEDSTNCQLQNAGDTITREPEFKVTGLLGAELTVSKTASVGQRLTWKSGTGDNKVFAFSNDGIQRVFRTSSNEVLLNFTTKTTEDITVSGSKRSNRVVDGGTLKVTNNKTDLSCEYTPDNVRWSSTCNCAVSGTWSGQCSNGKSTKLEITDCGKGDLTINDREPVEVKFQNCIGI